MSNTTPNKRASRGWSLGLGALVLGILVLGLVLWSNRDGDQTQTPGVTDAQAKPELPESTKANETALFEAAPDGLTQKIRTLLQQGTNASAVNEEGRTPLMLAAFNGHTHTVRELFKHGAQVDTLDPVGRTALIYAASGPNKDVVQLLLESQADPNVVDQDEGFTALMFAAAEGQAQVVEVLLAHGAEINARDIDGDTAYDFAVKGGHSEVARILAAARER